MQEIFFFSKYFTTPMVRFLQEPAALSPDVKGPGVKHTTQQYLMLRLSLSGALTPLPNTPLWRAKGQLLSGSVTTRILTINITLRSVVSCTLRPLHYWLSNSQSEPHRKMCECQGRPMWTRKQSVTPRKERTPITRSSNSWSSQSTK